MDKKDTGTVDKAIMIELVKEFLVPGIITKVKEEVYIFEEKMRKDREDIAHLYKKLNELRKKIETMTEIIGTGILKESGWK